MKKQKESKEEIELNKALKDALIDGVQGDQLSNLLNRYADLRVAERTKEILKMIDEMNIKSRIESEHRKHYEVLDWSRIAGIKIKSEIKQRIKEMK